MAKTCIRVEACNIGSSERHNLRSKELDYIRPELTHRNEQWVECSIAEVHRDITEKYKEATGQGLQKKATPIREGVIVISEETTIQQLQDLAEKLEERFGIKRDSIFGKDPFGSFRESFGSMDDMLKKAEEMFRDMGPMFSGESDMEGMGESISNGLEVIQENGKTRIKVNAKNSEVSYVIDGIEYAADSLKNGIPDEIATVNMITSPTNAKKSYVVINTKQKKGQFISYANGVLKYKYNKQEYTLNPEKLEEPALIINNRLTRSFNIDPVQIIQIRPVSELERQLLGAPSAQVIIVTDKMGFFF